MKCIEKYMDLVFVLKYVKYRINYNMTRSKYPRLFKQYSDKFFAKTNINNRIKLFLN